MSHSRESTPSPEPLKVSKISIQRRGPDFQPIGEPLIIQLLEDGSADLSAVTDPQIRETLEKQGVRDEHGFGRVMKNEGERFLRCLLKRNGQAFKISVVT